MIDKIASRAFPAFAAGFALYYAPAYCFNSVKSKFSWPLFTYFPSENMLRWGTLPGNDTIGPPMYWYGWIVSATLVGLAFAVIALLLPARATAKAWPILAWLIPVLAFLFLAEFEKVWFI